MAILIVSQAPVFNPNHGFVSHSSNIGPFVFPDSVGPPPIPPETAGDVTTVWADYTATAANYIILVDTYWEAITIYLPDVTLVDTLELQLKNIGSTGNDVLIVAYGTDLIDNNATYPLPNENDAVGLVADADGNEWQVIAAV